MISLNSDLRTPKTAGTTAPSTPAAAGALRRNFNISSGPGDILLLNRCTAVDLAGRGTLAMEGTDFRPINTEEVSFVDDRTCTISAVDVASSFTSSGNGVGIDFGDGTDLVVRTDLAIGVGLGVRIDLGSR